MRLLPPPRAAGLLLSAVGAGDIDPQRRRWAPQAAAPQHGAQQQMRNGHGVVWGCVHVYS